MPRIEPIPYGELPEDIRALIDVGIDEQRFSTTVSFQITAYSPELLRKQLRRLEEDWHFGLLEPRLQELVRLRSAQVNACEPCSLSRKETSIDEAEVACMSVGEDHGLPARERAALQFMEKLSLDHLSIDDADFQQLAKHFTAAEIVELGALCSFLVGAHRWLHALAILDPTSEPVIRYAPALTDAGTTTNAIE